VLRLRFPEQAKQVLDGSETFVPIAEGFAIDLPATAEIPAGHRGLTVHLPKNGSEPVRFALPGDFSVQVRESGMLGQGAVSGRAVAYPREGGTSYWSATDKGFEEWLLIDAGIATRDKVIATWEVEGATLRPAGDKTVELVDGDGMPRIVVKAPVAYGARGRSIEASLQVHGKQIELRADADGEAVLIDPTWFAAAAMSSARGQHTSTLLQDGRILVVGGNTGAIATAGAELYDPSTNTWVAAASLTTGRYGHTATVLQSGKVLVAGGYNPSIGYLSSSELYDPINNVWQASGSFSGTRAFHTSVILTTGPNTNKVLIAGGYNNSATSSANLFDPATNTWAIASSMSTTRYYHTMTALPSGKILVAGGWNGGTYYASTDIYDPLTSTWAVGPSMPYTRYGHTATLLNNGKVLIAGGYNNSFGGLVYCELYDPTLNTFTVTGQMPVAHMYQTANLLWNNQVLVAGGESFPGGSALNSAHVYEPTAGTWANASTMLAGHYWHAATRVLAQDVVLITGGVGVSGTYLSTAELYFPNQTGISCIANGECQSGFCVDAFCCNTACNGGVCDGCSIATGSSANGTCTQFSGVVCNDSNACTTTDLCQAGTCVGSNPVICPAPDNCHDVGVCNVGTGVCSNPQKANGTACNDNNLCTTTDTCQNGICTGNSVICPVPDQCHTQGACNPATGVCAANPSKADGTACNDGTACTNPDTCQSGTCTGANPVVCPLPDQCHVQGVCLPATGTCTNPQKANGTACVDATLCTVNDTCQNGGCVGGNPVTCSALDNCHTAGVCNPATGTCSNPLKADGTACSDGNACTSSDTCVAGTCTGANPVVCAAPDQCHTAGSCDPVTGVCVFPNKANGTACNDGNACTAVDTCQAGVCSGASPVVCNAQDQCHTAGVCDPATGVCTNPIKANNTACSDGNACTVSDVCTNGTCTPGNALSCVAQDQCHSVGVCNPATGLCTNPNQPDGSNCNDNNSCTQTDTCQAGTCTGGNAVVCPAPDQCHTAGSCLPATGACTNPQKANNTVCNDGNACTQTDTCQNGACSGANPVSCGAASQCQVGGGVCDPATGICSGPPKPDGTACNDGNACTTVDTCQAGVCVGSTPVVCAAPDQCHDQGVCAPATGVCSNPLKANGTACSDGNSCTQTDTCQAGVCTGANPIVCPVADQCHNAAVCNPATGICPNSNKADGTACNDANACTTGDTCQAGVCTGGNPVVCAVADQCHTQSVCNAATGVCPANPSKANGTACNDGNSCTQTDTCQAGVCTGANPVVCGAPDQCHTQGVCNAATGVCSNPSKADGTACNDGTLCTSGDVCQAGVCAGGNPVVCAAPDQCHDQGVCNAATGVCSNPAKANGTACNDGSACSAGETCQAGVCNGGVPVVCPAPDQCHTQGVCNAATGVCSNPTKANGTACNDGTLCTQGDSCQAGICTGNNPVVCGAPDQCHDQGVCNPATGVCSNPTKANGTSCSDGNSCTNGETCQNGACGGGVAVVCPAPDACHTSNVCNPATGVCGGAAKPNGTVCNDGDLCTQVDSCQNGVCTGSNPLACPAPDSCHDAGACNPLNGTCSFPTKVDGTGCSDGTACTSGDSCQAGICTGVAVVCPPPNQCQNPGSCNPVNGVCSYVPKPNFVACDDGNACTQADKCQAGNCVPGSAVVCAAQDECHEAGVCDAANGACSNPAKIDGSPCAGGTCESGECIKADGGGAGGGGVGGGATTTTTTTTGAGGSTTTTTTTTGAGGSTTTTTTTGSGTGGSSTTTGAGGAATGTGGSSSTGTETSSTGGVSGNTGGCGCGTSGSPAAGGLWVGLGLLILARRRRNAADQRRAA
jgi:N-acetylneuraminic acid mutarotase